VYITQTGALCLVPKGLFKAGDGKEKGPLAQHGFEITVRTADNKTKKFGVECFLDQNNGSLIYLTETGSVAVVASKYATATKGKIKGYTRTHGLNLKVRKAGTKDFTKDAKVYGVDVYEDLNNGTVLYLSETGSIAAAPRDLVNKADTESKTPDWQYGIDLGVRAAKDKDFSKDTRKYGVEAFKDNNNGCLVYITETGNVSVVPSKLAKFSQGKFKDPESKRGFNLAVRKPEEKDFSDSTKKTGIEVYQDENNGNLVYLSETSGLAAIAKE